jgi:DNA polymerase III subunit beta
MKIICSKSDLLNHLQHAQNIVNPKSTLPILANILLEVKDNTLGITSTDLEIGIHSACSVEALEEGKTTLPARKLFDIIKTLPDQSITIKVDDNNVAEIICKPHIHFKLLGLSGDDFPKLPDFQKADSWDMDPKLLKKVIRRTLFAVSRDESRYVLNGIYFIFNGHKLTAVSTDGRRLSFISVDATKRKDLKADFIIPAKSIMELLKLLDSAEELKIYSKENQVKFTIGNFSLITKLIEGNFPNYEAVIPKGTGSTAKIKRQVFLDALMRTSLFTSERANSIKLSFTKGTCLLMANTPELGEAREEIDVEYDASDFIIAFNPVYLIDVMKNIDEEEFTFMFPESSTAGVIKTDKEFLHVIMPMRISN